MLQSLALLSCFFTVAATTEISTLSLHDALPISAAGPVRYRLQFENSVRNANLEAVSQPTDESRPTATGAVGRSEEHTSELQSHSDLVCRLLLEKKKKDLYHSHFETQLAIESCNK